VKLEDAVGGRYVALMKLARARQFMDAVAAHDLEAAAELLDPNVETVTPRGSLHGVEACRQVLQKAIGDEQFAMEQAEPLLDERRSHEEIDGRQGRARALLDGSGGRARCSHSATHF
jgi:SnoaL-like protein